MRKSDTAPKAAGNLRRQPAQARAHQTIHTLFEAAAQRLDKQGETGLSTNKVAAAAGFSNASPPDAASIGHGAAVRAHRPVIGTLRSARLEKSSLLQSPAHEEVLLELVWALIGQGDAARPRT